MTHPFKVSSTYANRKGSYEVVSIDEARNNMVIRYVDSGDVTNISINSQMLIWENMNWEQEVVQQEAKRKPAPKRGDSSAKTPRE